VDPCIVSSAEYTVVFYDEDLPCPRTPHHVKRKLVPTRRYLRRGIDIHGCEVVAAGTHGNH
jgi:hypothetical protein